MKHVGLIVPSSNTSTELDFGDLMPTDVALHASRMWMREASYEVAKAFVDMEAPRAARELATLEPDAVVFACTAAGAALGSDGEAGFILELEETVGAPVVSTNAAVSAEIASYEPRRVAILTPYEADSTAAVAAARVRDGYAIAHAAGMGIARNRDIGRVTPEQLLTFAERELPGVDFDLLFVSCTNLRTAEAAGLLTEHFSCPVVTSNVASARGVLTKIGADTKRIR